MRSLKQIISIFLLLIYSLGFAHDVIPHGHMLHMTEEGDQKHHEHQHHEHSGAEVDHQHIVQEDHFDNDLLCFVVCFLRELEHEEGKDDEHYFPAKTNPVFFQFADNYILTLLDEAFSEVDSKELSFSVDPDLSSEYQIPDISSTPRRGPPVISC